MVAGLGLSGLSAGDLVSRGGVWPSALTSTIDALVKRGAVERVGERLISTAALRRSSDALVQLVTAFHRANPLSDGVPERKRASACLPKPIPRRSNGRSSGW